MGEMDGDIGCADLRPFVELRRSVINPSMPFFPLVVTVPLRERAVVPMRSTRGRENDVTLTQGEYTAEDALVTTYENLHTIPKGIDLEAG
jgi:hypothetical protein